MADEIGRISLVADTSSIERAANELDKFSASSNKAATAADSLNDSNTKTAAKLRMLTHPLPLDLLSVNRFVVPMKGQQRTPRVTARAGGHTWSSGSGWRGIRQLGGNVRQTTRRPPPRAYRSC